MTHLTKHHRRPGRRPLLEPIEPSLLFTTTPATTTTLTLTVPQTLTDPSALLVLLT